MLISFGILRWFYFHYQYFFFQLKIQENARLQSELADSHTNYRKRFSELETQLDAAKRESQKYKEMLQLRERSTNVSVCTRHMYIRVIDYHSLSL